MPEVGDRDQSGYSPEERALIWLDSFPLDGGVKRRLLNVAGSGVRLVRAFPEAAASAVADEGLREKMLSSLSDGGAYFRAAAAALEREGIAAVTRVSENYPDSLKGHPDSPFVLYAKGNAALLKGRMFTIVGSRRTPPPALKVGERIAKDLSSAFSVVTGTADGGDSAALEGALAGSGRAISVLAGGFGFLPKTNAPLLDRVAKSGLLLSAHTSSVSVRNFSFAGRNRLLARLGEGTLVIGAGEKSGALMTAEDAFREGRPVFALPYFPGTAAGAGCNALLKKGGRLTENSVDICGYFGINLSEGPPEEPLTQEEGAVLSALRAGEAHVAELSARTGIPVFRLLNALSSLETKGLAVRLGGNRFSAV